MSEIANPQTQTINPPPSEPPKKKSSIKWWIFGGCGCLTLIIIFLVTVGAIVFFGVRYFQAPIAPIKGQLKAINNGNLNKAYYDFTSNQFKKVTSFEQFKLIIKNNPQIFKSKSSSFNQVDIKNRIAIVTGTITGKDGTITKITYHLVKENNKWKIYSFNY